MSKVNKKNANANISNERGGNNMKTNEKFSAFQGEIDFGTFYGGRQGDLNGGTWHGGRQGDLDGGTWHGGRPGNLNDWHWCFDTKQKCSSDDKRKASALDPEVEKLEKELEQAYNKVIGNTSDGECLPPP